MADIDYRDMFWQIRTEVPGVPEPTLFMQFASAVREHLRLSQGWQVNLGLLDWDAVDDFPDMSAAIPTNTSVVQPVRVKWENGDLIPFKTRQELDELDGDWEQETRDTGPPDYWTISAPGQFLMYPQNTANETSVVEVRVAVQPVLPISTADGRTSIPQEIADEYQEHWVRGTLSKLLKIPGKDWTNIPLAGSYGQMFEQDIREAKARAGADFGRPRRRMQYGGLGISGSHIHRSRRVNDDYGQ